MFHTRELFVTAPCVSVTKVNGSFNPIRTLGSIGLAICPNRVRTLLKRGNTNGSALVGILSKVRRPAGNAVAVGGVGCGGLSRGLTTRLNVKVVCRRLDIVSRLAMLRGLCVNHRLAGGVYNIGVVS